MRYLAPVTRNKQQLNKIAHLMALLLGESPHQACLLSRRWAQSMRRIERNWQQAVSLSLNRALSMADLLHSNETEQLVHYLRTQPQGIVLVSLHMGDYLIGLFHILRHLHGRRIFIVRRKAASAQETGAFAKLKEYGLQTGVIRSYHPAAALQVHRSLCQGHVVVMLYDLPGTFGTTLNLQFLGQQVAWVKGPAAAAAMARAVLVPCITYRQERLRCALLPVSSPVGTGQIQQSAQQLADWATVYVRRYPDQWLHWHLVPEMVVGGKIG